MRVEDLPIGAIRAASPARHIYVPGPRKKPRIVRGLLIRGFAVAASLCVMAGAVGDQSALATLGDRPTWHAAIKAADPGIALSPHMDTAAGAASLIAPDGPPTEGGKKADRLASGVKIAPAEPSAVAELLTSGAEAALPVNAQVPQRVRLTVPPPVPSPVRGPSMTKTVPMASMLSAYAPDRVTIETPFALLLEGDASASASRPHGVVGSGKDHWWSDRPLPKDVTSVKQLRCLAEAIYFEARGESELGQAAVAQVVLNRVKNPAYPDDTCSVVYQNRKWYNRCQFTFACDRRKDIVRDKPAWASAERIAKTYARGEMWLGSIGAATHYHAQRVDPKWSKLMRRVKVIDNHVFYITIGGGWT